MNDSSAAGAPSSANRANTATPSPFLRFGRVILYTCLAIALALVAYAGYKANAAQKALQSSQDLIVSNLGVTAPAARRLAPEYTDRQGRLLADPPSDQSKLLDPSTLVLAYNLDLEVDVQPVDWEGLQKHLAQATGKQIVAQVYENTVGDVAAVKDGKFHIVALHAADTPFLVNNAGFIPAAVLGTEDAPRGNHLVLAVRPDSEIKDLADVRGRTLTSTRPNSITGHRAAVAVLLRDAGLRPNVDYSINFSLGQTRSMMGLVAGDYEIAAWSDDKLQSLLKQERLKPSDYRIIYESQIIPRFTIGHVHNLQPALAAKIAQAIVEFKNESAPPAEDSDEPMRFVEVDYKRDFEFVRKMDEAFDPRLQPKPLKADLLPMSDL